jgi:hypothetical protein
MPVGIRFASSILPAPARRSTTTAPERIQMNIPAPNPSCLDVASLRFYQDALRVLRASGPPVLVGGAYALAYYTGVVRHTKDLDLFVRPADAGRALEALAAAGYRTETAFNHWLAKAFYDYDFIDLIFSSGNGACPVDDDWFAHAVEGVLLGEPARLVPPEEMLWQKAYIMERERFDGADVAHLLLACGRELDWPRLLARFGPHWRVLFSHLVLFGFIYPGERDCVPAEVLHELADRWRAEEQGPASERALFQGGLLSRSQYVADLHRWGYPDARLRPHGGLTREQVRAWTDAAFVK